MFQKLLPSKLSLHLLSGRLVPFSGIFPDTFICYKPVYLGHTRTAISSTNRDLQLYRFIKKREASELGKTLTAYGSRQLGGKKNATSLNLPIHVVMDPSF